MDIKNLKINNISYAIATVWGKIKGNITDQTDLQNALNSKQETLVSGTNIKTVNNNSLLGSGNIEVQESLVSGTNIKTVNNNSLLGSGNVEVQESLVSGTNIKTVNNNSLLGSGNVEVQETLVSGTNIKTINNNSILGSGNITIQGGGGSSLNYSTTEQVVGTWIDGKPLYQITVIKTANSYTNYLYELSDLGIYNIDIMIIDLGGSTVHYMPTDYVGYASISYYVNSSDRAHVYLNGAGQLAIQNQNTNNRTYYITLKYTKTTDSANT